MQLYITVDISDKFLDNKKELKKEMETKLKIVGCYFLLDETLDNFVKTYRARKSHGDSFTWKIQL